MKQTNNIHNTPAAPLRAEPRHHPKPNTTGHIKGVEATSSGLIRATMGSAAAAGAVLVFFWLPAEYGIDPTGIGGILGLTEMGEIKQQLYDEAAAEDAALGVAATIAPAVATGTDPAISVRLDAIEMQLAAIVAVIGADSRTVQERPAEPVALAPATAVDPTLVAPEWRDEVSYSLAPSEGVEIKLVMEEGAQATFEWTANGAVLNFDTHGDSNGQNVTYERGRSAPGQQGTLTAAFSGNHGWFWRNRTDAPVSLNLRTRGAYSEMRAP